MNDRPPAWALGFLIPLWTASVAFGIASLAIGIAFFAHLTWQFAIYGWNLA